jgi:CubicO group peptidase (beta-lactamase class C family)
VINLLALLLTAQTHPVAEIDTIVRDGIGDGVYPGAVVVVGTANTVLLAKGYGRLTWNSGSDVPSPDSTLYDLASLTKIVATTPAIMLLVDRGLIDLDRPVHDYLAGFIGEGKDAVTVRHLLSHTSGLRAFLPLNTLADDAEDARGLVMSEPLRWRPGARVEYSDLNAMLVGWIVEAVSQTPLDEFVRAELHVPLGMNQTRFNLPRSARSRAAPINVWRGQPIRGVIHDQNAARLNGVAGHAGLYSTGLELALFAQMQLRRGTLDDGVSLLKPETVDAFTRPGRGHRALGWATNDTTSSDDTGTLLSPQAYGHGGFTGASIWIDPSQSVFVILLTNRVYAPRTRRSITRLKAVRGRLADAALRLKERSCRLLTALGGAARC